MNELGFMRVRIGVAALDNENGWRVVVQHGDHDPTFSRQSWTNHEDALAAARLTAAIVQRRLNEAGVPWGPG